MAKFNFYLGAASSAWLLAILIVVAELISQFKTFLANVFTHHWIGKGIIITIAFLVFGFILMDKKSVGNIRDDKLGWYSTIASLIVIFLFFVIEFVK